MKRLLAVCVLCVLLLGCVPMTAALADSTATVKGGWLKLRASASYDGYVLDRYYTGTKVTVLGSSSGWYRVQTPDGKIGYMLGDYLSVSHSTGLPTVNYGDTMYVTSTNGKSVRLRTGPDTNQGVIGNYDVGTAVTVLSYGATWSYVRIGSTYGYMMSQFLSSKKVIPVGPDEPTKSANAVIASRNGRSVNMRVGAGKGYSVIGSYSVGTKVNVLTFGNTWSHCKVGSQTGYIMTEFLSSFGARVHSSNGGSVALRSGAGKSYSILTSVPYGTRVTVLSYASDWCYISVNGWNGYMMTKFLAF